MPHDTKGVAQEPAMVPTALAQGGLMTTPSDMARLLIELMKTFQGKSHRIMSQEMTYRMFTKIRDVQLGGAPCQQGLGVFLFGQGRDLIFFHTGVAYPGATCWAYAFPERGTGAVIMNNGANGIPLMLEIIGSLTREYNKDN